jgi:UDP-N-acetyl-D-mannosaminuronic acid dehydrogenase
MRIVAPSAGSSGTTGKQHSKDQSRSVCVVGLGYVGLPMAAVLADRGYDVSGVDIRPEVVETINQGNIHIHEPNLPHLIRRVVDQGKLSACTSPQTADVFMICVPTPATTEHAPDLTYVEKAASSIQPFVRNGNLIILESTSPPSTTQDVIVNRAVPPGMTVGQDVFVAYCPERILPGRTLVELVQNERTVGGMTPACAERAAQFYESFVTGKVSRTSALIAELVKLTENAFRDVNIAFANEISMLANELGADVFEIIELANKHPRVKILSPGPGVGGHCISVDPWFLIHARPKVTTLMQTARHVNDHQPHVVVQQVVAAAERLSRPVIGCLGLAYKPDVDDLRESPSLVIVRELRTRNVGEILVCDPLVANDRFSECRLTTVAEVLDRANILVLLTNHGVFNALDHKRLIGKILIDPTGAWRRMRSEIPTNTDSYVASANSATKQCAA